MTNFFQNLPIPKELRDALNSETSAEDGSGGGSRTTRRVTEADGVPGPPPLDVALVYSLSSTDYGNTLWLEDEGNANIFKYVGLPTCPLDTQIRIISMPAPGVEPGVDNFTYVGHETYASPLYLLVSGVPLEDPLVQLTTGNGCTFTHIADEDDIPVWELTFDYPLAASAPLAHASSHAPNGSDPLSLYDFEPVAPIGFENFSSANYLIGAAGECAGNASGFNATVICRLLDVPTGGLQTIFGNWNPYAGTGGWFIGVDNDRWKFGVADTSDGMVIESASSAGPADLDHFRGGRLHSWHVITLTLYGATAYLVVDGEVVAQINPSSGFQPADSGLAPYIGRSANGGVPTPASSVNVAYWQYGEEGVDGWTNFTPYQITSAHLSVRQQRTAAMSSSIGDSKYTVVANADVVDDSVVRANFTRVGGVYPTSFPNFW